LVHPIPEGTDFPESRFLAAVQAGATHREAVAP
jgi:hypothetical protein